MAYFLQASLLVLLLLLQTPANSFAKSVEDSDLASLLEELEVDRISKREEQNQVNDRSFTKEDPGSLFDETSMDFPENVIDNVDHMKEERKLSGLDHIEDTITKDDDKTHNKRTIINDVPNTADLLMETEKDTSNYPEVIPREVTELLPGTEMDLFLSNGNDEVLDEYEPVGCYRDRGGDSRPLPVLLANLRPSIDWKDLNKTIRACATLAQAKGYRYFGIQFYGECWSGPTADQTYDQDGSSDSCVAGVGKTWANFVYRFKEDEKTTVFPATTVTPSPECSSYIELSTADRAETNDNRVYTCDNTLTKGWYRFTGQAGTHMATKCVPRFHCGTHAPGWMSGTLPSAAEGIVNRKVCFNWRNDCCYWKTQVRVKNCGGFYVYAFQKPPVCRLRYCGSNKALPTPATPTTVESTTTKPSTPRPTTVRPSTKRPTTVEVTTIKQDECTIYRELDTADRAETYGPKGVFKCDDALLPGWYRFTGKAGNHMATKCAQLLHCGTHSPGWMSGTLPSVAEGIVKRGVCFNWNDDCCHYNTTVLVRNCGGFYVYNLQKPPLCRLRYCGSNNHGTTVSPNTKPTTSRPTTSRPTTRRPTTRRPTTRRPMTRRPTTVESTTRPTTSRPTTKRPTTVKPTTAPIPLPIQTFRLCEHRSGVLRCPSGEKIKIRYANYGRTTGRSVCPHPSIRTMKCYSSVAANLVRCACNGHNSCPLYAKNQVYGDPCVGTFKYIEVKYQCVA